MFEFTGERFLSNLDSPEMSYEHWHRYLFATLFVEKKTVLDVACGEGYGSYLLARYAAKVVGVDISRETIDFASSRYLKECLSFKVGALDNVPVEGSGVFDVIISFETIEHIDADTQVKFLAEVKRLLKPGGILIISTPNKLIYSDIPHYKNQFHVKEFYYNEFKFFLGKNFKYVSFLGQKIYPVSYMWNLWAQQYLTKEFLLKYTGEGFEPLLKDDKVALYLIAICSDNEIKIPENSILVDVSERLLLAKNSRALDLADRLREKETLLSELQSEIERRNALLQNFEEAAKQRDVLLEALQSETKKLAGWGKALDEELRLKNERIEALQAEVQTFGEWGRRLDEDLRQRNERIFELQAEVKKLGEEVARKNMRIDALQEEAAGIPELLKAKLLDDEIRRKNTRIDELRADVEKLEKELLQRNTLLGALRDEAARVPGLLDEIERIRQSLEAARNTSLERGRDIDNLRNEIDTKNGAIEALENTIRNAEERKLTYRVGAFFENLKKYKYTSRAGFEYLGNPDDAGSFFRFLVNLKYYKFSLARGFEDLKILETYPPFPFAVNDPCDVSIIVSVRNNIADTYDCLKSLRDTLDESPKYEVIVVDDASTDETSRVLQAMPGIQYVKNTERLGFYRSLARGASKARGSLVCFLDASARVQPGWLRNLLSLLDKDEKTGLAGPKLVSLDEKLLAAGGILWKDATGCDYGASDDPERPEYNYAKEVDYLPAVGSMIRKELWNVVGGFDATFSAPYLTYANLSFEAGKNGYRVMYQPASVVVCVDKSRELEEAGGSSGERDADRQKFVEKWKDVLEKNHFARGENLFCARDRSARKKTILVIDHYVPLYDKDAGSRSTFHYLRIFAEMGLNVKFIGDNFYRHEPYTTVLGQMGIEVLYGIWYYQDLWKDWVKENGPSLDYVCLNRPHIAPRYLDFMKEHTHAKILYYGLDLHCLREMRRYELEGDKEHLKSCESMQQAEFEIFSKVNVVYYPSSFEIDHIKQYYPDLKARVLPLYIYDEKLNGRFTPFEERKNLLFVGGFNHPPNVDGILWFSRDIFPAVLKRFPDVKLYVVGSNPPDEIKDLSSDNLIVTGFVSDDELMEYYRKCRLVVAPLRYGAGIKGKIVEAIYNRVPVVTTSVGAEGFNDAGVVLTIADEGREFADRIIDLYDNRASFQKISGRSSKYIEDNFSRECALRVILQDIPSVTRKR